MLGDEGRDGGSNAARVGRFVKDRYLVRSAERRADRFHVEGLERAQLDEVDVHALGFDLLEDHVRLLDAVQVGERGDRLACLDGRLRSRVQHDALVEARAHVEVDRALGLLHRLHRREEDARAVIADHGLREAVRGFRRGRCADLEARDAHHVRVERLRVLGAQRLIGCSAARADDRHGHLELSASGRVRVARARHLGDAEDAEVGVHELDNGAVAVHAFAERLADEVALVDDLVRGAQRAKRLLRELGDIVARARLQVLGVDRGLRVAEHFL